jgi:hypothetical protein
MTFLLSMQRVGWPLAVMGGSVLVDVGVTYLLLFGAGPTLPALEDPLQAAAIGWDLQGAAALLIAAVGLHWSRGKELLHCPVDSEGSRSGEHTLEEDEDDAIEDGDEDVAIEDGDEDDAIEDGDEDRKLDVASGSAIGTRHNVWKTAAASDALRLSINHCESDSGNDLGRDDFAESARLLPTARNGHEGVSAVGLGVLVSLEETDASGGRASSIRAWLSSRAKWVQFREQMLPNMLSATFDMVQFTIITLLAARLGNASVVCHATMMSVFEVCHTIAAGMGEATAIRVGSQLGRGDVAAAKLTACVAVTATGIWGVTLAAAGSVLLLTCRRSSLHHVTPHFLIFVCTCCWDTCCFWFVVCGYCGVFECVVVVVVASAFLC